IFYLHSRLLERSAKLSEELGGGSITALPIIETLAGDISAYIPTNVISITDGQIYLESELFNSGMRPAINVGLSVSRVGGSAQRKAMRKVSGTLRLQLAQYRELVVFTQFGSDIDSTTLHVLKQGERLTEALKQPRFSPYSQAEQVLRLRVLSSGLVEDVEPREVNGFLKGFTEYFSLKYGSVLKKINETGDITPEDTDIINIAVKDYLSDAQH
ncbi:MAG: F0F1 ATP synthase subunit alpha, partial [Christensenellales bacterium]